MKAAVVMHIYLWTRPILLVPPCYNCTHDSVRVAPYLSLDAMTESPATVTPIVRPLSHEKGLHSPTNFTLSLGPRASFVWRQAAHSLWLSEKSSCFYNAVAALYVAEWWMKGKRQSWGAAETHTPSKQWLRRVRPQHGSALCARLSLTRSASQQVRLLAFTHSQRLWQHAESTGWGRGALTDQHVPPVLMQAQGSERSQWPSHRDLSHLCPWGSHLPFHN